MDSSPRQVLPTRRRSYTWKVKIDGKSVFLTYSTYQDGSLAEVFIDVPKYGSAIQTWMQELAMLLSIAIQHRVPFDNLISLFSNSKSDPCGRVEGHPDIVSCTSIMDFVVRCLSMEVSCAKGQTMDKRGSEGTQGDDTGRFIHNGNSEVHEENLQISRW